MPKRGAIALLLTGVALALLLSFKTPDMTPPNRAGRVAIASPAPIASGTPGVGAVGGRGDGGFGGPRGSFRPTRPNASAQPGASSAQPGASSTPGSTPAPAPGGTPAAGYRDGTYTGDGVQIRWGTVQVQVTVSGGRITAVAAIQMPDSDRRTQRIAQAAEPILQQEALSAQSANIDLLSGATYTSEAYQQSLQAALDQAAQ